MDIQELWANIKRLFAPLVAESETPPEPEVRAEILPTQTRALLVTRDVSGRARWLMIAASAVVNKVGAIDSTALFDSFIRKVPQFGYPVLDFLHEGERVRFGVTDWLTRDGALYLASGTFDDTDLGRAAAVGLEAQPNYWGGSIAYRVTTPPLIMVAEGQIPVYTDGVNDFISIVPRRMAANLFTATSVTKEVRRMDIVAYEELVKLVGEERAKVFAGDIEDANRTITETGMITRAEVDTPPVVVTTTEIVREDAPPPPADNKPAITLEELSAKVDALAAKVAELSQGAGAMQEASIRVQPQIADLVMRLAGVEASKTRWDEWLNDAPESVKRDAEIYRARNQEPAPMTLAQLAEQTTSKFRHEPQRRH